MRKERAFVGVLPDGSKAPHSGRSPPIAGRPELAGSETAALGYVTIASEYLLVETHLKRPVAMR